MTDEPVSVSVGRAAEIIGISPNHAYKLVAKGDLPGAYRMGGRILVHVPTLLSGLETLATKVAS